MIISRLGLVIVILLTLAGCSNMKQINRITFITALGIDKSKLGVKVYALAAVPGRYAALAPGSGGSTGKPPNYILTAEGRNVAEALFIMKRKSARDIEFGHTKIFLFSNEMAKQGIDPCLDLFMRRAEFQPVSWIGITPGSVKSILEIVPEAPETVADALVDTFSQYGSDTSEVLPIYMFEFYSLSAEVGQSPFVMFVKNSKSGNKIEVSELAVFKKDKLVGHLSPEETKMLYLLQKNKLRATTFTIGNSTTFNLLKYHNKIKVNAQQISIQLQLELEFDQNEQAMLVTEAHQIDEMEQRVNESVQDEIKELVSKLQHLRSDPAGFGNKYRTAVKGGFMSIDEWENELFPEMKIEIKVKSTIQRRGVIK
ncbi:Ger(x)C family spore germination protein [Paenibacillus psychroresistens]|uniref:Ger(X)C family spore germination protein n=1 Tax=Paenibacillus psychroresistens TaxID=1778678 RepID=A0A6B8RSV5_9BACL|nr:Ger(x)C family spore germination protein [Paenibacillus psychroresistens]QGQ99531.1 Ger(x)C family spore germination protein [Paenibacillus psychroresistens]